MRRIAILTSGGDSQGMNTCLIGVAQVCAKQGIDLWAVRNGFSGLVNGDFNRLSFSPQWSTYLQHTAGGSVIGCGRYPQFKQLTVKKQAQKVLQRYEIDGLIVIGGNGSYVGVMGLTQLGVKCIAIPGTIDNDVAETEYTIGFDTTANFVLSYLDRIRTTSESYDDCQIVEVMGRSCGDIAIYSGIAALADLIITKNSYLSERQIIDRLNRLAQERRRSALVVVVEHLYDVQALAKQVSQKTPYQRTRASVVGYAQRGGAPSINDRVFGLLMGVRAVELLLANKTGLELVIRGTKILAVPLAKSSPTQEHDHLLRLYQKYQF